MENRIRAFDWYQNQGPWMTLNDHELTLNDHYALFTLHIRSVVKFKCII